MVTRTRTAVTLAALAVAMAGCEIIAGIKDHTPEPADGGGAGGQDAGGKGGASGDAGGLPGTGGASGTGGRGTGGASGTGGGGAGGSGSGGVVGSGGSGSGGMGAGGAGTGAAGGGTGGKIGTGGSSTGDGGVGTGGAGTGGVAGTGGAGTCVTTFSGGQVLYSFDTSIMNWLISGSPPGTTTTQTSTDGHTCPGALVITAPFTAYGTNVDAVANFSPAMDFTGQSALHFWIKIAAPGGSSTAFESLLAIEPLVQSNNYSELKAGPFTVVSTFADGGWHEVVVSLTTGVLLSNINQIAVQVFVQTSPPDGGPPAPSTTTVLIDDIWIQPQLP